LKIIRDDATLYERLDVLTRLLTSGLHEIFNKHGIAHETVSAGSMFCTFFHDGPVTDLDSALTSDTQAFGQFFRAMLDRGIYLAPSQFEAGFMSSAHTTRHIEQTLAAADASLAGLAAAS
jgi:glutamate-1-semialdehyde 2,1-aminomutase